METNKYKTSSRIKEYALSIDSFNTPTEYTNARAIAVDIIRLFLLEPGTLQNNPECGIGLYSRYKFTNSDRLHELEETAKEQIQTYLAPMSSITVDCSFIEVNVLLIRMTIDTSSINLVFDKDNLTLKDISNYN